MITIKSVTLKNFLSVGNVTQAVNFQSGELTLVIGNNLDLGGNGARNGTGKSTILNALCFALYGNALTNIKKDNLINKTNNKEMMVTVDFEKNGTEYRIERGRRPNVFRFLVNSQEINNTESRTDEAQGEGRLSQEEIEKLLGMSHTMFKHLVALNTFTEPFLSMSVGNQREIIEQLLGITQLSEKAVQLKELIKNTKDAVKEEEYRIKATEEANQQIERSIKDLERRQRLWKQNQSKSIEDLNAAIAALNELDIEAELAKHTELAEYLSNQQTKNTLSKEISRIQKTLTDQQNVLTKTQGEIKTLEDKRCYTCGQPFHSDDHTEVLSKKTLLAESARTEIDNLTKSLNELTEELNSIKTADKPITFYQNIADAYEHKNSISQLEKELELKASERDPYVDQVSSLQNSGIKAISWDKINELTLLKDHQEFLLRLLTNKDSFIRKKIIEQNLSYLNTRLENYLEKLGLPHSVVFKPDLSVEISELGRELDFDNLSRGERNRLILGLSWSFRDVFETMNDPINFMSIDELIDSGMDGNGVDAALEVLKKMTRERNKCIYLISHREELISRVSNTLLVTKENGFTTYSQEEPDLTE
jgi:DNA repair exonuclease SbcCD ATPase subunit